VPRISLEKDNLDERNREFAQVPLKQNLFLNSVPKCGTHLIRNIMRMFVPVEQHYTSDFIQIARLTQHKAAFDPNVPKLSWGHLLFDDEPAVLLRDVRKILLVRDPYDWVLARARFYLSENFDGKVEHIKDGAVTVDAMLNMMIFGVYRKVPTLEETFRHNGAAWMGSDVYLIRYEELVQAVKTLGTRRATNTLPTCSRPAASACPMTGASASGSGPTASRVRPRARTSSHHRSSCPTSCPISRSSWSTTPRRACASCSAIRCAETAPFAFSGHKPANLWGIP
jgi:hypothetical protein